MRKVLLAVMVGLFLTGTTLCQAEEPNPLQKAVDSSVGLFLTGMSGDGTCTGVLIKNTAKEAVALTAKHCVANANTIYMDGELVTATGVSVDHDIAYVKTQKYVENKTAIQISERLPKPNDVVVGVGYPLLDLDIVVGVYKVITENYQVLSMAIRPGFSGGGLFSSRGELVGIMVGAEGTLAIAEKLETIHIFVVKNKLLK